MLPLSTFADFYFANDPSFSPRIGAVYYLFIIVVQPCKIHYHLQGGPSHAIKLFSHLASIIQWLSIDTDYASLELSPL